VEDDVSCGAIEGTWSWGATGSSRESGGPRRAGDAVIDGGVASTTLRNREMCSGNGSTVQPSGQIALPVNDADSALPYAVFDSTSTARRPCPTRRPSTSPSGLSISSSESTVVE